MSTEQLSASSTPPPKFSRYRSVKRQAESARSIAPPPLPEQKDNGAAKRSMSRYRSTRPVSRPGETPRVAIPPTPKIPHTIARIDKECDQSDPVAAGTVPDGRTIRGFQGPNREVSSGEILGDEERSKHVIGGQDERFRAQEEAEQARKEEENAKRILGEEKRRDLERLEAQLDAAASRPPPAPVQVQNPRTGLFSRKRNDSKVEPRVSGESSGSLSRITSNDVPQNIRQGGGGIVPGTDAPKSAVNAGERRVLIRCNQSSFNLPINPETTPRDLVHSAANIMSQHITPSTAILMESYTHLGLERRIRRYEHIRDIMNSWDRDTQNALLLQHSDSPNHDQDLESSSVPKEAPKDLTVYMYHSQRPGKWNKRYITLLSSGQIFTSKKPGVKSTEKDVANICHVSDFDIYTPTAQQIRKYLKPPKKHCYAVKSQQKTTMFLSTENFVHFFSTDDESIADKWYSAVQNWRSWYLVNRMGEGQKQIKTSPQRPIPISHAGHGHRTKVPVDEDPYTIGSFAPLINMDRFNSVHDQDDSEEEDRPRQIPFHLRHTPPLPSHEDKRKHPPPVQYRIPVDSEEEFDSSGLLGRTYTQRQQARKGHDSTTQGPFIDGPSLLNTGAQKHNRTASTSPRRPATSGSASHHQKPAPLLNFTPQFKEASQWDKIGKGRGVAPPSGLPLVEVATTPENALGDIPKATGVLRRDRRPSTAVPSSSRAREGAFVNGGLVSNAYG